ncbi:MAG: dihydrolipoyl dehydrogenase [Nitrospirota bacterium]|nr:MAG: dihydrolipoyl dehydrogenase [Nitrospirota bacterium]
MSSSTRIVILGSGPGGYVAAIRAAQLGGQVTVIENQALGGVCLNWGCIPSKALLSVVELGEKVKKAGELGIKVQGPPSYDLPQMVKRKNGVVAQLVKGIATLFKTWGITHLQGWGELIDERTVRVTTPDETQSTVTADAIVLATGSSWPNLPLFPIDGKTIISSKEALDLEHIPSRLLIIGGGVEGCEFASLYSGLGSHVDLVEMLPTILPTEDEELIRLMTRELKKNKVQLHTGTTAEKVEKRDKEIAVTLKSGEVIEADTVLVSVGRPFNTQGIGLEKVGVRLGPRGEIEVNDKMETNVPGVYAIGDVVGKAMLAHVASAQGKVAVENILGRSQAMNYDVVPAGIFTLPEIGRVGLTEQQAQAQGFQTKVGRFRYAGLGKAQAVGETTGIFKVITDSGSNKILGVHIMGSHAADLVHEAALAMQVGTTASDLAHMIHAHPTLAEGMMEAAEDVEGLAIHQARKRT